MSTETLAVDYAGRRIGTLSYDRGASTFLFDYDPSWTRAPDSFDLSPDLTRKVPSHDGASVRNFFSNLLPEGEMLEIVSTAHQISKFDSFGILRKIGAECAGALSITENATPALDGNEYEEIDPQEIRDILSDHQNRPLVSVQGRARMSLSGVQDKITAVIDKDGRIYSPVRFSASTHIIKPNNRNKSLLPHTVVNEFFCMCLADRMGIDTAKCRLLDEPGRLYVVDRFDRIAPNPITMNQGPGGLHSISGGTISRIHQIDTCQLLGLPPNVKYEEPEYKYGPAGPGIAAIIEGIASATGNALAVRQRILRWVILNYLIGNSDSHAKNFSLTWSGQGWKMAPAYDLLSVVVYSKNNEDFRDFAFNIGGETRYEWVHGGSWGDLARDLGIRPSYLASELKSMSSRILVEARKLQSEIANNLSTDEQRMIDSIIDVIEAHAGYARESIPRSTSAASKGPR